MKNPRKLKLRTELAGWYKIEAIKPDGSRRVLADWFPNLILDAGLNRMGTSSYMTACQVGTGSAAPATTDTALQSILFGTSNNTAASNPSAVAAPWYGGMRLTWRFTAGQAAGNLSEVGVGWGTSGNTLFSRALILDGGGSPTTITVLSDEIIDVTYELRLYAPAADAVGTITISGTNYDFTVRAGLVGNWAVGSGIGSIVGPGGSNPTCTNGAIAAVTATPSGTNLGTGSCATVGSYANNSLSRNFSLTFPLTAGNDTPGGGFVGLKSVFFSVASIGEFQAQFTPPIPKINTQVLVLNFTATWARKAI